MVKAQWPFRRSGPGLGRHLHGRSPHCVGPSLLRLRGHYFAIGTLALNEATRALVQNLEVTGGGSGLALPITTGSVESTARFFYYLFFGAMALTVIVSLPWSPARELGYGLRSIRANEDAADGRRRQHHPAEDDRLDAERGADRTRRRDLRVLDQLHRAAG